MRDRNHSTNHARHGVALALVLIGLGLSTTLLADSWIGAGRPGVHPLQRSFSFEERVVYQRAIEEVYWRHRNWPRENLKPKPALDQVMPSSVLQGKVEDYLRKSQALGVYWQRPITGEQLQAEMDRMGRQTKQPEMLEEVWAALGNDPYVIAECLARPALANRLIRSWYAQDERYHGELKRRAEGELRAYGSASQMRQMRGEYREVEWLTTPHPQPLSQRERVAVRPGEGADGVVLSSEQWETKVHELVQLFGRSPVGAIHESPLSEFLPRYEPTVNSNYELTVATSTTFPFPWGAAGPQLHKQISFPLPSGEGGPQGPGDGVRAQLDLLPLGELSPLQEEADLFYVTAVMEKSADQVKVATVAWKKEAFAGWWSGARQQVRGEVARQGYGYRLAQIKGVSGSCADDTWTPTPAPPDPRFAHTAVWTGSEMIVWGGRADSFFNTGGRYDAATDSWTPTSTLNAPSARYLHTAVWTGGEMIVWGGRFPLTNTGGRYNPATDGWTPTSTSNAPSARRDQTAVWTGSEMIVWGGCADVDCRQPLNTGGRYDPASDSWTPTSTLNAPSARWSHTAVWTGSEMIVWGGLPFTNTGGRYGPATDSWTPTSSLNAPSERRDHTAVWTESEMIVWGGSGGGNTGGRYDPASDSWTPTGTLNAPSARESHTAVWTGGEMIVWGGGTTFGSSFNTGGRYDPATDSWTPTGTLNAPSARESHTAVWTGSEMIVWGGAFCDYELGCPFNLFNTGGRYDPASDSWTPTSTLNAPSPRSYHTAVWTGSEMIVWGGFGFGSFFNTGGRYDPATDSWTPTSTLNAPSARDLHTAVWTGSEMIVWGGFGFGSFFNTGGRYDPASDSWTPTSTLNAPSARRSHVAVWTGSEMIVWGGRDSSGYFNTGARYDPASDSWMPTGTLNAPSARESHTAVWTGSEMIVWGGIVFNTGGRYDPATDTWTPTSTLSAPSARYSHTAVWTGSEMIVWGGRDSSGYFNTGGRYDPASDSWMPTGTLNAPSARESHTAVWTGSEMIVWGGFGFGSFFNTGGRYDPASDSWTPTSTLNAPSGRANHTAVWTGSEMIVWGGSAGGFTYFNTGGRYCASVAIESRLQR